MGLTALRHVQISIQDIFGYIGEESKNSFIKLISRSDKKLRY